MKIVNIKIEVESRNRAIAMFMGIKIKALKDEYCYKYEFWTPTGIVKKELFFGVLKEDDPTFFKLINQCIVPNTQYHKSWDWLMPVVEKIGGMMIDRYPIMVTICDSGIRIAFNRTRPSGEEKEGKLEIINTLNINYFILDDKQKYTMRESVWFGITEFIEWYNKKQQNETGN
jgi:hypothetical protein